MFFEKTYLIIHKIKFIVTMFLESIHSMILYQLYI